jgi:hypothetical protein
LDELPDPVKAWSGDDAIASWVRVYLGQLEEMFGDEGLSRLRSRSSRHPAVELYDLMLGIGSSGGMSRWPDEFESAAAVGTVGLDLSTWAPEPPYDDFWSFLDSDTRNWTLGALAQPDQFEDVMAELFTWGWLRSEGFDARRVNDLGTSDIVLDETGEPWRCEVKRIHVGTPETRVARIIAKANQQIKKTDPDSAGTLFVSLAREPTRAAFDDRVPNDVEPYVATARAALETHYRSVAQVVVMWDDVMILGNPPDPVLYAFRRRSVVVEHQAPRQHPKYAGQRLSVGRSATVWIRWSPRSDAAGGEQQTPLKAFTAGDVEVTQLFRQENEVPDGIRARHAIEAFLEPDAVTSFDVGGMVVWLATRRVAFPTPYTLVLLASQRAGEATIQIAAGFRLYRDKTDGAELWQEPQAAFETLIQRYGLPVRVGEVVGRFVPAAVAGSGQGVQGEGAEDSFFVSAFVRPLDDGRVEYAWVFAIDTTAYRSAARAHDS